MPGSGLYGKLPSEGDFVTRRLPWEFTSVWDDWLQQGMHASRIALGAGWLESYLSAPIWRFHVAPGVCGPMGWRGLFFASVDRVGRYFPLTLAFADAGGPSLASLSADADAWIAVEDAALAGLSPTLPVAEFDRRIEALAWPAAAPPDPARPAVCLHAAATDDCPARSLSFAALPPSESFVDLIAPGAAPASSGSLTDLL
ncbi:MAG: type VI secretion system-associated protein TagF [Caulobacter sp.]|nr:type VI secretion system-associated protein TagF [Vitreoscilla sp.]